MVYLDQQTIDRIERVTQLLGATKSGLVRHWVDHGLRSTEASHLLEEELARRAKPKRRRK
jgi:hypothetical protein